MTWEQGPRRSEEAWWVGAGRAAGWAEAPWAAQRGMSDSGDGASVAVVRALDFVLVMGYCCRV